MKVTKPISCIIIDDEFHAVKLLEDYVAKVSGLELLLSTTSALEALHFLNDQKVDLIFLDVQMPELTGIELMNVIKSTNTKVILTTAYSSYALDGYTHDIIDYLLKPITFERFLMAVNKAQKRVSIEITAPATSAAASPRYIFVKTEYRVQKVLLPAIFYIEGLGDYLTLHTSEGKILTLARMKMIEEILPDSFMRIHKSFIVNIDQIEFIEKGRIVINKEYLPIGDSYKEKVRKQLGLIS